MGTLNFIDVVCLFLGLNAKGEIFLRCFYFLARNLCSVLTLMSLSPPLCIVVICDCSFWLITEMNGESLVFMRVFVYFVYCWYYVKVVVPRDSLFCHVRRIIFSYLLLLLFFFLGGGLISYYILLIYLFIYLFILVLFFFRDGCIIYSKMRLQPLHKHTYSFTYYSFTHVNKHTWTYASVFVHVYFWN